MLDIFNGLDVLLKLVKRIKVGRKQSSHAKHNCCCSCLLFPAVKEH